jgi:hypothetical protein
MLEFTGARSAAAISLRWRRARTAAVLTFAALSAFAQPAEEATPAVPEAETKRSAVEEEKRAVPDYDGRGPKPSSVGRAALWVPRIIVSPLYLTTRYVIAAPLGAFVTTAEKHHWPTLLIDFFTFGEDHEAGLIPLVLYDFGLRPTVGLYFFWDRAFSKANSFRASVAYGGSNWVAFGVSAGRKISNRVSISLSAGLSRRPDAPFYGIGPAAPMTLSPDIRINESTRPQQWSGARLARACCAPPSAFETLDFGAAVVAMIPLSPPALPWESSRRRLDSGSHTPQCSAVANLLSTRGSRGHVPSRAPDWR